MNHHRLIGSSTTQDINYPFSRRQRNILLSFVLPKEMLTRLRAEQGAVLYAIETPVGYTLTSLDPRVKDQVESAEAFMDRYRDVFAALAK